MDSLLDLKVRAEKSRKRKRLAVVLNFIICLGTRKTQRRETVQLKPFAFESEAASASESCDIVQVNKIIFEFVLLKLPDAFHK